MKDSEMEVDRAYDRGYKTALDSVKLLIMGSFDTQDPEMIRLLKMIEELEEEEEDEE